MNPVSTEEKSSRQKSQSPALGFGLSLKTEFCQPILERLQSDSEEVSEVDWFEIIGENYLFTDAPEYKMLLEISKIKPISAHCVSMSIGSHEPLNTKFLERINRLCESVNAKWITDHLCFSSANGYDFGTLIPLPFTWEAVEHVIKRIKVAQSIFGIPFGIENPSYYAQMPGAEMSELEFMNEILEKTDSIFLLDINNVIVNGFNHYSKKDNSTLNVTYDQALEAGKTFLKQLPLERVVELHVAGHIKSKAKFGDYLYDTHGATPQTAVLDLLSFYHNELKGINSVMLERDSHFPGIHGLNNELKMIKKHINWQV